MARNKISRIDRLYSDEGTINVIDRRKTWYGITIALILASLIAIAVRGFNLSLDFEGGTKINMPAANLVSKQVEDTFIDATGVTPDLVQIVGSGDTATLEITSQRLSEDQVTQARQAIFDAYQPLDDEGQPSPDAIGSSTVSESWGSSITTRMLLAMLVFLAVATVYVAIRLQRFMAAAAIIALIVDAIVIAGFYSLFGFEVSPAVVIGLLTTLTFSIYDTVIVFDKVNENTEGTLGQRQRTYADEANLAVNQTIMRSLTTTIISALPIIALLVVAVWLLGIGTLRDLALIQLVGVIEGIFSSLFLATPLLVSITNRTKKIKEHNAKVARYRDCLKQGIGVEAAEELADATVSADTLNSQNVTEGDSSASTRPARTSSGGTTWRPGR